MFLEQPKKRRVWPYVLIIVLLLAGVFGIWAYRFGKQFAFRHIVTSSLVQEKVKEYIGEKESKLLEVLPEIAGISQPKTYLLLFANNTELRPGGGFLGVYAVVRVSQGDIRIIRVEGTEVLDRQTPSSWKPIPPQPLTDHLKVDRWYFRDSNWSPDFVESSKQALAFYAAEGGIAADDIDAVIAVTPTVLEHVLAIVGPVTVQGMTFTAENVTEKLEYEVEYGYDDRGVPRLERKKIIEPFFQTLLDRVRGDLFVHGGEFWRLGEKMAEEKHIMVYAIPETWQTMFDDYGFSGRVKETNGDYLLWVDANLAALKTDHAMLRTLRYALSEKNGEYIAEVSMRYKNNGSFDWRTTRYRTYARIFVPDGARLIGVEGAMKTDRSTQPGTVEQGKTLGKQWFGTFIAIEPGEQKTLTFRYALPKQIGESITNGSYSLLVQKQLGTIAHGLTLDLNFGRTITTATPGEEEKRWGDTRYQIETDLRTDRTFRATFK
ncbi:MAG TPA: DUF4012 domain-containing protein [Candidatus Kapabacteria bacterium]|nr:DUF4012 domain-containing protein [Candidatus Kapabacteria bacterium]